MSFAKEKYVTQMRDLLLQHGANESGKDRERWALRQRADIAEKCGPWDCLAYVNLPRTRVLGSSY